MFLQQYSVDSAIYLLMYMHDTCIDGHKQQTAYKKGIFVHI